MASNKLLRRCEVERSIAPPSSTESCVGLKRLFAVEVTSRNECCCHIHFEFFLYLFKSWLATLETFVLFVVWFDHALESSFPEWFVSIFVDPLIHALA